MQFKMFHRPKPKQFSYKPIYFDPAKEENEQKKEAANDFRAKFREETEKNSKRSSGKKNINIAFYLVIIVLLVYLIFFS